MNSMPALEPTDQRLMLLAESHLRLTGRPLVAAGGDLRRALWDASTVIVAHGTECDPVFFYGNQRALTLFEMEWASFVRLPSRLSAEPLLRDERARLMARVTRDGCITDYAGVRISSTGQRFRIEQAMVWNLIDEDGACHGQAAAFDHWEPLPAQGRTLE